MSTSNHYAAINGLWLLLLESSNSTSEHFFLWIPSLHHIFSRGKHLVGWLLIVDIVALKTHRVHQTLVAVVFIDDLLINDSVFYILQLDFFKGLMIKHWGGFRGLSFAVANDHALCSFAACATAAVYRVSVHTWVGSLALGILKQVIGLVMMQVKHGALFVQFLEIIVFFFCAVITARDLRIQWKPWSHYRDWSLLLRNIRSHWN